MNKTPLAVITCILLFTSCTNPGMVENHIPAFSMQDSKEYNQTTLDTSFFKDPLPELSIGNLYVMKFSDSSYSLLLLADVERQKADTLYAFYASAKIFRSMPSKNEILKTGLLGNTILSGVTGKYYPAFTAYLIEERNLNKMVDKLLPFASIRYLTDSNQVGGHTMFNTVNTLLTYLSGENELAAKKHKSSKLLDVKICAVAFDYLAVTNDRQKAASPRIVTTFAEE